MANYIWYTLIYLPACSMVASLADSLKSTLGKKEINFILLFVLGRLSFFVLLQYFMIRQISAIFKEWSTFNKSHLPVTVTRYNFTFHLTLCYFFSITYLKTGIIMHFFISGKISYQFLMSVSDKSNEVGKGRTQLLDVNGIFAAIIRRVKWEDQNSFHRKKDVFHQM